MRGALIGRAGLGVLVIALLLSLGLGAQVGAAPSAADREAIAANRRAATLDAASRLRALELPPGVTAVGEGRSEGLSSPPLPAPHASTLNLIDFAAWWKSSQRPTEALAWFEANAPAGSALKVREASSTRGASPSWTLGFEWPSLPEEVSGRMLFVTVTALTSGGSFPRADSQAVWTVPHPASEKIPESARLLEVRWQGTPRSTLISNHRTIRKIAGLIDALPVVQPWLRGCPAGPGGATGLHLRFLANRNGPALATATQLFPPIRVCGHPFQLTIHGQPQQPLEEGGKVLKALKHLRSPPPTPAAS